MNYLRKLKQPASVIVRSWLEEGLTVSLDEVVTELYATNEPENKVRARAIFHNIKTNVEKNGRILVCRAGTFKILGEHESGEALHETRLRKQRAESYVRSFSTGLGYVTSNYPELRGEVRLQIDAFSKYLKR